MFLADGVPPAVAKEHCDPARPEGVLHPQHDRDAKPAHHVGGNHSYRKAPPAQKAAGQRVRDETKLFGGREDFGACLGAQGATAVEDLGGSPQRDPGPGGDVGQPGRDLSFSHSDMAISKYSGKVSGASERHVRRIDKL